MGLPNPSRETKFSAANRDREVFIDLEQDWQPYQVDPYSCYMCDNTHINTCYLLEFPEVGRSMITVTKTKHVKGYNLPLLVLPL